MSKILNSLSQMLVFCLLFALCLILAFGKGYNNAVLSALNLWIACVLPSLFPYFFITAILSSLKITGRLSSLFSPVGKRLFGTGGTALYAFFISVLSGYPMGAKTVCDLKLGGAIGEVESQRASALCSTSSPMFLLGSVGNLMFNSPVFGLCLFSCHLLSAIIIGVIFSFYKRDIKPSSTAFFPQAKTDNILYESAYSSVISVLVVGGLITVFYLLTEILLSFNILSPLINLFSCVFNNEQLGKGVCLGLFECTRGLKVISSGNIGFLTLPTCALICGFGGLSVIMQSIAYLKKAKIKTAPFVFSKLLSAVVNFIVGIIFSLILGF